MALSPTDLEDKNYSIESFDNMAREIKTVRDSEEKVLRLLTERQETSLNKEKNDSVVVSAQVTNPLSDCVPTKKRSIIGEAAGMPNAVQVDHQNKGVKRVRFADEIGKPLINITNSGATAQIAIDEPTPDYMPQEFKNAIEEMNGSDVKLVIEKDITGSDINKGQGRLLIPFLKIRNEFLEDEEKALLEEYVEGTKKRKGMNVKLIQPSLEQADLCLKKWPYSNTDNYALISNWNTVVMNNSQVIVPGASVQLFAFRVENQLWMALVPVRHGAENCSANNNNNIINGSSSSQSSKKKKRGCNINGETCSANNINGASAGSSKSSNNARSPAITFRKRSRKGNPRRSPLF